MNIIDLINENTEGKDAVQKLIDFIPAGTGIYVLMKDNVKIQYINDIGRRMIGMSEAISGGSNMFSGTHAFGSVYEDDREAVEEMLEKIKHGSIREQCEFRIVKDECKFVWILAVVAVISWGGIFDEGITIGVSFSDISRQKEREEAIVARVNAERKKLINADRSLIGLMVADLTNDSLIESRVTASEAILSDETGYREDGIDMLRNEIMNYGRYIIQESSRQEYIKVHRPDYLIECYERGETSIRAEYQVRLRDGHVRWISDQMNLIQDADSGHVILYEYLYNIQVKKMLEEFLNVSMEYSYEIVGTVDLRYDQISVIQKDGAVFEDGARYDDNAMLRGEINLTCAYEQYLTKYAEEMVYDEDRALYLKNISLTNIRKVFEKEKSYEFTYRVPYGDENFRIKRLSFYRIESIDDTCMIARSDVTGLVMEEEQRKKELEEALDAARKASAAKSEFLSNMSHEIRTPMNAIIGLTKLAETEPGNSSIVSGYLHQIDESGKYLLGVINDILEVSRIENGKFELRPDWIEPLEVLPSCIEMIKPSMDEKNIKLIYSLKGTFPVNCRVLMDLQKVRQMIMNILNNACKYTPPGGTVSVKIRNLRYGDGEALDQIIVTDTGYGMSKEFMKRIFRPFEQERNAMAGAVQGTGLGLVIARQTAAAMGGDITVESELGKGSSFTITLPYKYKFEDVKKNAAMDLKVSNRQISELEGKNILIAEDHELNLMIAKLLLEKQGMKVHTATDGKECLDMFVNSEAGTYDAILMDIRMPVMNGLDASRAIRNSGKADSMEVPIIAMTANAFEEDRQASRAAGMNEHLSKPINPDELYETLLRYTAGV